MAILEERVCICGCWGGGREGGVWGGVHEGISEGGGDYGIIGGEHDILTQELVFTILYIALYISSSAQIEHRNSVSLFLHHTIQPFQRHRYIVRL